MEYRDVFFLQSIVEYCDPAVKSDNPASLQYNLSAYVSPNSVRHY